MTKLTPTMKLILTFFISFFVAYSTINLIVSQINKRENALQREATRFLQHEISKRFQLTLDVALVIGQMSSVYINEEKTSKRYGEFVQKALEDKDYIIGLSHIGVDGKIIRTYPEEANQGAAGKVSQNLPEFMKSYERGEKFWFSHPIQLYQGTPGFIFYIPIKNKNKLQGWIAPVISSNLFFEHFRTMDFFSKYELIIKDEATENIYLETGLLHNEDEIEEVSSSLWGRNIIFQSWPKTTNPHLELPFWIRFLSSLLFALIISFFMKEHLQKEKAYSRLEDISDVLKITSNEILAKLMDIQNDYLSKKDSKFINTETAEKEIQSVTNLFEQVELLQNIASTEQLYEETFEILPLLTEQLNHLREIVNKKNLKLKLDSESFREIKVTGNKWLISNTVLKNALSFSALISRPDGKIEVTHTISSKECSTLFYIEKIIEAEMSKAFRVDRRLLVAQNVMNLLNGEITIYEDGSGGMILKISTAPIS